MDQPKLKMITAGEPVSIGIAELRRLTSNPKTEKFTLTGASRRWIRDLLERCQGQWAINKHPMSAGIQEGDKGVMYWQIVRKTPAIERGVLIAEVKRCLRELTSALDALFVEIRVDAEAADAVSGLSFSEFSEDLGEMAAGVTTFAGLLKRRDPGEAPSEQ